MYDSVIIIFTLFSSKKRREYKRKDGKKDELDCEIESQKPNTGDHEELALKYSPYKYFFRKNVSEKIVLFYVTTHEY